VCQQDIINYLKKNGRPVDIQELLVNVPANRASISRNCKKLRESQEIKYVKKKEKCYEKYYYMI
jgi:DNA-binding IclR family transcriptional regulator